MFGELHVKIDKATWTVIGKNETPEEAFIAFHKRHNRPYEGMNAIQRSNAEKKERAADKWVSDYPEPVVNENEPLTEDDLGLVKIWADEI